MLRTAALTATLVATLALAGCGGEDPDPQPRLELDQQTSSSPASEAPTSEPAEPATAAGRPQDADEVGNDVYAGALDVDGAKRTAVAEAWVAYWRLRVAAFAVAEVGTDIGTAATGSALTDIVDAVADLAAQDRTTVGDLVVGVDKVTIDGDTATLSSCLRNYGTDRDAAGKPVEPLEPFLDATGQLVLRGETWLVSALEVRTGGPC